MTFTEPGPGWCISGVRNPHYVDMLVRSNAPFPMCQACTLAWMRDDQKGTTK